MKKILVIIIVVVLAGYNIYIYNTIHAAKEEKWSKPGQRGMDISSKYAD